MAWENRAPLAQSGSSFVAVDPSKERRHNHVTLAPSARSGRADCITVTRRSSDLSGSSSPNRPGSCRHLDPVPGMPGTGSDPRSPVAKPSAPCSSPWHRTRRRHRYLAFSDPRKTNRILLDIRVARLRSNTPSTRGAAMDCAFRGIWAAISRDLGHAFHTMLGSHFAVVGRLADVFMGSGLAGLVKRFYDSPAPSQAFS